MTAKQKYADMSSVIRVLNKLESDIAEFSEDTIFFKTPNKELKKDLEGFSKEYNPLVNFSTHNCSESDSDCSIKGYYVLRMNIQPDIHQEASKKLYEILEKYE
jgi:hypothetical protein